MKRSTLFATCCLLTSIAIFNYKSSESVAQDKKIRALPVAPAASQEAIASLISKGAYQYAVSIRSTSGAEELRMGDPTTDSPRYSGIAAKGLESYGGIPMKEHGEYNAKLPSSLYYKIKVESVVEETAQVILTVGYATDLEESGGVATWNEQVWTVSREVQLDKTDSVTLTAPTGKNVPSFEVRYRVRKFDGRLD